MRNGNEADFETLVGGIGFPLFALAVAQHYGLPTSGLDVTNRLDVALFFALMRFDKPLGSYRAKYSRETRADRTPVLYLLFPTEKQQFDYERFRSLGFPAGRPDAQSAYFMHMGWGQATNTCAQRIFLALYLDPEGDYGVLPSAAQLFPRGEHDRFAGFLATIATESWPQLFRQVFDNSFYTVE